MPARPLCLLASLFALAGIAPAHAAAPTGLWLTEGGAAVIALTECGNGAVCGRIAGIRIERPGARTPVDWRGRPQCGLTILDGARPHGAAWTGHITDPRDGSVWNAKLTPQPDGTLHLRGYLGLPLLGQTQVWTRFEGPLPPDCRLPDVQQAGHQPAKPGRG